MPMMEAEVLESPDPPQLPKVTFCPPGRRSRDIVERPKLGTIPVTTQTALQWPQKASSVPTAKDDRRPAKERVEAAERAEALSVALSQPHRQGQLDERFGTPLGRWCDKWWPGEARRDWRNRMFAAGEAYDQIVRDSKIALGLPYIGQAGGDGSDNRTEAQKEAARELALMRRARADACLRQVKFSLPSLMERFAYEQREPAPYDEDILRHGLWKIADEFGLLEKGVHDTVDIAKTG